MSTEILGSPFENLIRHGCAVPPSPLEKAKNGSEKIAPSAVEGALTFSLQGQAAGKPRRPMSPFVKLQSHSIPRGWRYFVGHLERSGIAAESKFYSASPRRAE